MSESPVIVRFDVELSDRFERRIDELLELHETAHENDADFANYQRVTPEAKHKLKGILQHYAKMVHPFATCVRDQVKHGLPQKEAEGRCAVIKDLIWGTTKWRGKGNPRGVGPHPVAALADAPEFDADVIELVDRLDELELWELMGIAALDDDCDIELRDFSPQRRQILARKGHALPDGSYPIENRGDVENAIRAIGRAKNRSAAMKHIVKRARALGATALVPAGWS